MSSNEKYKMFKNFLHNELNITKEDIHEWINESIKEEVKKVVEESYKKVNIESQIKKEVNIAIKGQYGYSNTIFSNSIKDVLNDYFEKNFEMVLVKKPIKRKPIITKED